MKNADNKLNEMLRQVTPPERSPGYWDRFPKRVTARLQQEGIATNESLPGSIWSWVRPVALAVTCVAITVGAGFWVKRRNPAATQLADARPTEEYRRLYAEIAAMFPNQVRAIVSDENGVRLDLSPTPTVPMGDPVLIEVCGQKAKTCRYAITFSGQTVTVGDKSFEVLANGHGNVMVVGNRFVWSSDDSKPVNGVRIQARRLEG